MSFSRTRSSLTAILFLCCFAAVTFAQNYPTTLLAGGWTSDGKPLLVLKYADGIAYGTADNDCVLFEMPAGPQIYVETVGGATHSIDWRKIGTDHLLLPAFQVLDNGSLVAIQWERDKAQRRSAKIEPKGSVIIEQIDYQRDSVRELFRFEINQREGTADIIVSPDMKHVAWATTNGLRIGDIDSGKTRTFLSGKRIRFPSFSTDGKL